MDFDMPSNFMEVHRYGDERVRCENEVKRHPRDDGVWGEYGEVLLCLGQLDKALEAFRRADDLRAREFADPEMFSRPWLEHIGTVLWLLGRRHDAIATFHEGAQGVLDDKIKFGDLAGGASHGLLLWYAGVTAEDSEARKLAEEYLSRLAREREYGKYGTLFWPQHLPLFVIGRMTREQVLMDLVGTSNVDDAILRAREQSDQNKAIWGDLVQGLFYLAVHDRAAGREAECRAGMARCAAMENPITAVEWFLARAEAGYVPGTKDWPWRPVAKPKSRTGRK